MTELPSGTVTFLFTDLEDSTRLWEAYPEAMRVALARHDEPVTTRPRAKRSLDAIGADEAAHLTVDITGIVARLFAREPEDGRTLANPSRLIQALRWFAATRRPDETEATIDALEECLAHSRAIATPDNPDVLQALGLLAKLRARRGERTPAIEALREAVVRARDTGQVLVLLSFVHYYAAKQCSTKSERHSDPIATRRHSRGARPCPTSRLSNTHSANSTDSSPRATRWTARGRVSWDDSHEEGLAC